MLFGKWEYWGAHRITVLKVMKEKVSKRRWATWKKFEKRGRETNLKINFWICCLESH